MSTAGGFTNNIGEHHYCYACGKAEHQYGDPPLWPGDKSYCSCTPDEKVAAAARGLERKDIGFSEFKRVIRLYPPTSGRLFSMTTEHGIRRVYWPLGLGPIGDNVEFQFPTSSWGFEIVRDFTAPTTPNEDGSYTWLD